MKNTFLVFVFLFVMVFHEYKGAQTEKRSSKKIRQEIAQSAYHRLFAAQSHRGHVNPQKAQETFKHNSKLQQAVTVKPIRNVQKNHGPRMEPHIKKAQHAARLNKLKKADFIVGPLNILCKIISFINKLLNLSFLGNLCKESNANQTTIKSTTAKQTTNSKQSSVNTVPSSTTQQTTKAPIKPTISFSSLDGIDNGVYLTCHHVPGTIKLINATFGSKDPSCPPTNVASYINQYTDGKTSLWLTAKSKYFGGLCGTINATTFLNGTYTCNASTTPGVSMKIDSFDDTQIAVSCPGGTIALDSAMYGSFDGVTCPPSSVISSPAIVRANSSLTSFSLLVASQVFNNLCSNSNNKLSMAYRCETTSASTFQSISLPFGSLNMICPLGEISVSSAIAHSQANYFGCFLDITSDLRSLMPPKTTEVYFTNLLRTPNCINDTMATVSTSYICANAALGPQGQLTIAAFDYSHIKLQCPYGKKIHLVTSKYYCGSNGTEKVYQNPAGLVKKCEGKESICYFDVVAWNVLDMAYSPDMYNGYDTSLFQNCPKLAAGQGTVMLSVTYTCTG